MVELNLLKLGSVLFVGLHFCHYSSLNFLSSGLFVHLD